MSVPRRSVDRVSIQLRLRRSATRLWPRRRAGQNPARQVQHLPFRRSVSERAFINRLLPAGFVPGLLPAGLLAAADVVVVDVETTGWLAESAGITEIGAVRLTAGLPPVEFSALVNPQMPIPAEITTLTGITDEMVKDQPAIGQVLPRFIEFAKGSMIVAHNAPFDLGFLTAACAANDLTWPHCAVIDTAVLARLVLPPGEVTDHKLTTLAAHFGTRTGPCHRALADAKATADVLAGLLGRVERASAALPGPR
jgi:DNA polymerase III epsilon subunit family exonuclease